ncbi:hypothetical protein BC831DRAFT_445174 [Entophlyctis helioformis]|nr:hypothetical protein BC831DRAFT_462003 [Entophlyctis helioformis]KAI8929040.1 hypothetical protein BC831DRAFT_445174 [Entophlyctis helioformis]
MLRAHYQGQVVATRWCASRQIPRASTRSQSSRQTRLCRPCYCQWYSASHYMRCTSSRPLFSALRLWPHPTRPSCRATSLCAMSHRLIPPRNATPHCILLVHNHLFFRSPGSSVASTLPVPISWLRPFWPFYPYRLLVRTSAASFRAITPVASSHPSPPKPLPRLVVVTSSAIRCRNMSRLVPWHPGKGGINASRCIPQPRSRDWDLWLRIVALASFP